MRTDNAQDMSATLARMFGASPERAGELGKWLERHLGCDSCAAEACELLQERIERFPAPKQVMGVYLEVNESPRHAMHLGQSAKAAEVGRVEAFWHTEGAKVIEEKVGDHDLALFIAAQLWWNRVLPEVFWVRAELGSTNIWEDGARAYLRSLGGLTPELMAAVWHRARKNATHGWESITEEELYLGKISTLADVRLSLAGEEVGVYRP